MLVSTSDSQASCDFEDPDLCGWSQDPTHEFDWKRNQFATPSGHAGTGPSFDHTFGEGKGGYYLFMEASAPRSVNDTARLFSPVYPSEYSGGCFIFWYHMFGSTTGGLRVYVKPESHVFGEMPAAWTLYGDQGNRWFRGNISVPHISENFQIIIEGIRGSSYIGDTAIDDVSLNEGDCESIGNSTDNTSETFSDSCRGRCRESSNSSACGCNDDCVASRSCCYDFDSICTKNTETETDETKNENTVNLTTIKYSSVALETELPEVTKPGTTSTPETPVQSLTPETTQLYTETSTNTVKDVSVNDSLPVLFSTTTPTEKPTSPTTTSLKSTSTIATTTKTTITTQSTTTRSTTTVPSTTTSTTTTTAQTTITTTSIPTTTTLKITTSTVAPTTSVPTTSAPITSTPITSAPTTSTPTTKPPIILLSSTSPNTTAGTTASTPLQTTTTEEPSTRKIYNLRPRNRTTVSIYTTATPVVTIGSLYKPTRPETITSFKLTTPLNLPTSPPTTVTTRSTSTTKLTTAQPQITSTPLPPKVTLASRLATRKFTFEQESATEKSAIESEAHASKTESVSTAGSPVVTIVSVIIVIFTCVIVGAIFFVRRWKAQKLTKLDDDSEMKFLSENEVVEYSDSSALDRINFNP